MGMGRNRSSGRAGWPDNLYPCKDGYKYRRPDTKKESWMGKDRARAFEAARKLNAMLLPSNDLVARVVEVRETVSAAIALFRENDMPGRKWSDVTALGYRQMFDRIERAIGPRDITTLGVRECAEFLRDETESVRSRQVLHLVLSWVFACAIEEGWIDTNPVLLTRKGHYTRARERLTADSFDAIWNAAEPWLRNAMDLSLVTLLRREDIVSLRFADHFDGKLHVVPSKTENSTGARLRIAVDGELAELLARCRDNVVSPYIIHRLPARKRPRETMSKAREHHTQVLAEQLTRAFADARDIAAAAHPGMFGDNPPTFHEIRSLGAARLRERGWPPEAIQRLLAHGDVQTTHLYLGGHEVPWTDVSLAEAGN